MEIWSKKGVWAMAAALIFFAFAENASAIDDLSVARIEVYSDKSKIPDIGTNGWAIPSGVRVAVLRTGSSTYVNWKFVAYGESLNGILSLWLMAKAQGQNVSCIAEDRGNYWVQCVGVMF